DGGAFRDDVLARHGDVITAGGGDGAHRDDDPLLAAILVGRFALAKLQDAFVEIIAGGDSSAVAVDAYHDLFAVRGGSGAFDLPLRVAGKAFVEHPFDANDGDLVLGSSFAGVITLVGRGFAIAAAAEVAAGQKRKNEHDGQRDEGQDAKDE